MHGKTKNVIFILFSVCSIQLKPYQCKICFKRFARGGQVSINIPFLHILLCNDRRVGHELALNRFFYDSFDISVHIKRGAILCH